MTTITTQMPATGLVVPPDRELRSLREIVTAAYPDWKCSEDEFRRAFIGIGYQFRLAVLSRKYYFGSHVDHVNDVLITRLGMEGVSGSAVMCAVLAHGDVLWQKGDASKGVILSLGLDPHSGLRCRNAWQSVLKGGALLAPILPPKRSSDDDVPVVTVQQLDMTTGQMRTMPGGKHSW